jgi:transcriptional regulator with XRE-family HTH domain
MVPESITELAAFGLALRKLRQKSGLSQEALAAISGLHRTYVGSVERGERNVSLLNIHVLAVALKVTASELIHTAEIIRHQQPKPSGSTRAILQKAPARPRKG